MHKPYPISVQMVKNLYSISDQNGSKNIPTIPYVAYIREYHFPGLNDLYTDTAAILILPPGNPIVLIEIYLFFCSHCDNAAL